MSRVLFDKSTPRPIARFLSNHLVTEVEDLGWGRLIIGRLLDAAENAGFEILLTADKRMRNWPLIEPHVQAVVEAVDSAHVANCTGVVWRVQAAKAGLATLERDFSLACAQPLIWRNDDSGKLP